MIDEARKLGIPVLSEVFSDRTYQDDGKLTPRTSPGAMIADAQSSAKQVLQMVTKKTVTSLSGKVIPVVADTVCIHGDGSEALAFAKNIYQALIQNNVVIKHV
jgi:UPF0271 protein